MLTRSVCDVSNHMNVINSVAGRGTVDWAAVAVIADQAAQESLCHCSGHKIK